MVVPKPPKKEGVINLNIPTNYLYLIRNNLIVRYLISPEIMMTILSFIFYTIGSIKEGGRPENYSLLRKGL